VHGVLSMFLDAPRDLFHLHLLHDATRQADRPQRVAAVGTGLLAVIVVVRDLLGRKGRTFLLGMTRRAKAIAS